MSYIKISGIDENSNIIKWLKINNDEENLCNQKKKELIINIEDIEIDELDEIYSGKK